MCSVAHSNAAGNKYSSSKVTRETDTNAPASYVLYTYAYYCLYSKAERSLFSDFLARSLNRSPGSVIHYSTLMGAAYAWVAGI